MKNPFKSAEPPSIDNIYSLEGRVPLANAIPFGLQHVLAMFVGNLTPLIIIAGVAQYNGVAFTQLETAQLLQNSMVVAGIGTLVQLYPIWKIGARLPIVMGLSFTFLAPCLAAASKDYGMMVGGIIVGGLFEGLLGLTVKYWRKLISPIVCACVVTAIGLSILNVGAASFAGKGMGDAFPIGCWQNLTIGAITLISALVFHVTLKGFKKQLYVLFALVFGYIVSICFGMVNFDSLGTTVDQLGIVSLPHFFQYAPKFDISTIISFCLVFMVSAVETIGDTTAVCTGGLNRDIKPREVQGTLLADAFSSIVSGGIFNCSPSTSYSQNVGLIAMTRVVNRFCIFFGALALLLGGLFPPIGAFFSTMPAPVLGGVTVIMFGSILMSGVRMIQAAGMTNRNVLIAATSISLGVGLTQVPGFFSGLPQLVDDIFGHNMVAGTFVVALLLDIILPKNPACYEANAKQADKSADETDKSADNTKESIEESPKDASTVTSDAS